MVKFFAFVTIAGSSVDQKRILTEVFYGCGNKYSSLHLGISLILLSSFTFTDTYQPLGWMPFWLTDWLCLWMNEAGKLYCKVRLRKSKAQDHTQTSSSYAGIIEGAISDRWPYINTQTHTLAVHSLCVCVVMCGKYSESSMCFSVCDDPSTVFSPPA